MKIPTTDLETDLIDMQDWESAKRVLGRSSFMDDLRNYNKEDTTSERRKSLKRYVEDENMSVDRLRKVSHNVIKIVGFLNLLIFAVCANHDLESFVYSGFVYSGTFLCL